LLFQPSSWHLFYYSENQSFLGAIADIYSRYVFMITGVEENITIEQMKEKILEPNNDRFVIFPIEHNDIWEFYKQHQAAFWTAEEVDLSKDIRDWENLSDNERYFLKNILPSSFSKKYFLV
jgi:hypothetical protein